MEYMPDLAIHQRQAEHNQRVSAHLQAAGDEYLDWAVTAMFYSAMHMIDQVLAHSGNVHPRSHQQRRSAIGQQSQLAPIYRDYRELEWQSQRSRYECATFTVTEVQDLIVRLERIEQLVEAIVLPLSPSRRGTVLRAR